MVRCPLKEIAKAASDAGVPFLVIGGYAVLAHGYVRTTEDLDLLISREERTRWIKLLDGFGMSIHNDAGTFLQFIPRDDSTMKVDLMFVGKENYEQLSQAGSEELIEGARVRVVSLLHLVALKCHAIQNSKTLRRLKDMDDLIQLILINKLDLNEPELRATILKHGNPELYEKLRYASTEE
jgi:predicted nucleotidyltransferase